MFFRKEKEPEKEETGGLRKLMFAGTLGAVLAYILDPDRGRTRRARAASRAAGMVRRPLRKAADRAGDKSEFLQERAQGVMHEMRHGDEPPADLDQTLAHKVESEVLGREEFRKHVINVNAVDGVVTLRGQIDSKDEIEDIKKAVSKVAGVKEVRSFLHTPGTPAPNKAEALRAS